MSHRRVLRRGTGSKSVNARQDVPNVCRFNEHNGHALRVIGLAPAPGRRYKNAGKEFPRRGGV